MTRSLSQAHSRLLRVVFEKALEMNFGARMSEIYGVWTLCFQRFCERRDAVPGAAQVPNFLSEIAQMGVTGGEKDRALDAVMFALSDVYPEIRAEDGTVDVEAAKRTETGQMMTQLLLETNLRLSEAVRLETANVDVHNGYMRIDSRTSDAIVQIPASLLDALTSHVLTLRSQRNKSVPVFQSAYDKYVRASDGDEEKAEAATQVMKTLFMHVQ